MKILCMLPAAKGIYPEEDENRRIRLIQSFVTPTTQIDVDWMPGVSGFNPFGGGASNTPESLARAGHLSLQRILQAEQEGYDAFIPFGMMDFGVRESRGKTSMPVVSQTWSAFRVAALLGVPFFTISYDSRGGFGRLIDTAREHGLEHLMVSNTAAEMSNAEMPKRRQELKERVVARAQEAKQRGAKLLMVTGMSICPVEYAPGELSEAIGLPVIEGMSCAVAVAELLYRLGLPAGSN